MGNGEAKSKMGYGILDGKNKISLDVKQFKIQWHIVVQDPRSAISHDNLPKMAPGSPGSKEIFSVRDPRPIGSPGNAAVTTSKISTIPRENENIISKALQDLGSWILGIQDPGYLWDLGKCLVVSNDHYLRRDMNIHTYNGGDADASLPTHFVLLVTPN